MSNRFGFVTSLFDSFIRPVLPSYRKPDIICAGSDEACERFSSALGVDTEKVIPTGYPRWEVFNQINDKSAYTSDIISSSRFDYVILYAPTHRKSGRGRVVIDAIPGYQALARWLRSTNSLLIIRPHDALTISRDNLGLTNNSHICVVGSDDLEDVNELLICTDILITDYSSIIYDYAVLRRPFIMLAYDLDDYIENDAGIYGKYVDEFCQVMAANWFDVISHIKYFNLHSGSDFCREFGRRHSRYYDGLESKRILGLLEKLVEKRHH